MSRRTLIRRTVQVSVLGLLITIPLLNLAQITLVSGTLCSIGTDNVTVSCPLGAGQVMLASRSFDASLFASALAFILLAFVLGRVFCSWVCPQGTLSESADALANRVLGIRKKHGEHGHSHELGQRTVTAKKQKNGGFLARLKGRLKPDSLPRYRRGQKVLLGVLGIGLVSSLVLGFPVLCYICPIGLICRQFVSVSFWGKVGAEIVLVVFILTAEVFIARRGWCKYLCPVGAVYGLLSTKRSLRIVRSSALCVGCHSCEQDCPMGCSPLRAEMGRTCTNCALCLDGCPEGALSFKIGRGPKDRRRKRSKRRPKAA